jgi:hypothetical protein
MILKLPELQYPPYNFRSQPGTILLQSISGAPDSWQAKADLDIPDIHVALPDNTLLLDRLQAKLELTPASIKFNGSVEAVNGKLIMAINALHEIAQQRGKAEIALRPLSLAARHNIPGNLLHRWPWPVHVEAGTVSGHSDIRWQQRNAGWQLEQTSSLQLDAIQGSVKQYPFSGLHGTLHVKGIDKLQLSSPEGLRLEQLLLGVPVTDILVQADATRQADNTMLVDLHLAQGHLLGGRVSVEHTQLDSRRGQNRLTLTVQGLDIARLIELEQKKGLYGTGQLSGRLPIVVGKDGFAMDGGTLAAQPPYGVIQYRGDERAAALAKNNKNMALLLKALSDFHYNLLEADLDYSPSGQLLAKIRLQGINPELERGRAVHLNINIEENIPALLKSLQFADEISRQLEKGIQQRPHKP